MIDERPANGRFRLQDEGKAYPRSSCQACGRTVITGLGNSCKGINTELGAFQREVLETITPIVEKMERCESQAITLAEYQRLVALKAHLANADGGLNRE